MVVTDSLLEEEVLSETLLEARVPSITISFERTQQLLQVVPELLLQSVLTLICLVQHVLVLHWVILYFAEFVRLLITRIWVVSFFTLSFFAFQLLSFVTDLPGLIVSLLPKDASPDVVADSPWQIFGCENGNFPRLWKTMLNYSILHELRTLIIPFCVQDCDYSRKPLITMDSRAWWGTCLLMFLLALMQLCSACSRILLVYLSSSWSFHPTWCSGNAKLDYHEKFFLLLDFAVILTIECYVCPTL